MKSSALKLLAQKAKKRLSTAGQNISEHKSENKTTAYLSQANYAIVANNQTIQEDPLFEKVKKLLEKGDILNPLAELTNQRVFNSLTGVEKEKYILDIAKRYKEIKDYFAENGIS